MTAPTPDIDHIETFHGTSDGAFGITLIGGHIEALTLPTSAMNPTTAEELGTTLVALINEALDKHIADLLEATVSHHLPIDPEVEAVESFVARAVAEAEATIAAAPSLQRDFDADLAQPDETAVVGTSPNNEVEATLVLGQLRRLAIDEHSLATSRPADLAAAVVSAVRDALNHNVVDQQHLIDGLIPEHIARETREIHQRIVAHEGRTP